MFWPRQAYFLERAILSILFFIVGTKPLSYHAHPRGMHLLLFSGEGPALHHPLFLSIPMSSEGENTDIKGSVEGEVADTGVEDATGEEVPVGEVVGDVVRIKGVYPNIPQMTIHIFSKALRKGASNGTVFLLKGIGMKDLTETKREEQV